MKHKTLKRVLCFLLAFVVMVSIPLDIQAHAVATETWMVYALITYLAGMGITFTVSGGVNAMIQAMEEKVKDYEQANNIVDFYEYARNRNVRLVPNNNQDPDGNRFFDLFFTASAVEAIQAFANWLTSEGEWQLGTETNSAINQSFVTADVYKDGVIVDQKVIKLSKAEKTGIRNWYNLTSEGDVFNWEEANYQLSSDNVFISGFKFDSVPLTSGYYYIPVYKSYQNGVGNCDNYRSTDFNSFGYYNSFYVSDFINGKFNYDEIIGITYIKAYENSVFSCLVYPNNNLLVNDLIALSASIIQVDETVEIMTPEELQEQFPSVDQGVSIADAISVPMGDPTLAEWAQRMEETFDLTGTIPQPVPEVIADPDVVPQPSPVPTPPVYEDVDGLGLPSLAETMKNKFPFCLPYDLGRVFQIFYAEPVAPYWEVDLFATLGNRVPFVGETAFTIDLAEYEDLGRISRWMTTIGYTLLLILITRQTTKW